MKNGRGFTLIELMITLSVLSIIAMVAVPKFTSLMTKAHEGATKGKLGEMRTAVSVYYADNEGVYPSDLTPITNDGTKYSMRNAVPVYTPAHGKVSSVEYRDALTPINDTGGWSYGNNPADSTWGTVSVGCTHPDLKGAVWSTY